MIILQLHIAKKIPQITQFNGRSQNMILTMTQFDRCWENKTMKFVLQYVVSSQLHSFGHGIFAALFPQYYLAMPNKWRC